MCDEKKFRRQCADCGEDFPENKMEGEICKSCDHWRHRDLCRHCQETVDDRYAIDGLCSRCSDEACPNEDPLQGDVDRHPEQLVAVTYPGPNGPEVHYEPETFLNWCDICGDEIWPEEGRICPECRMELDSKN